MLKNILFDIKNDCLGRNIPIISDNTKTFLDKIIRQYQPLNCLEIGGAVGYSGLFISSLIKQWGGNLISFELSYPSYKEALHYIQQSKIENFKIYNCNFNQLPIKYIISNRLNFVFIDGKKSDYLNYFTMTYPYMDKNCVLIFDDVIKYKSKLNNLYTFLDKNQLDYELLNLDEDDGIIFMILNDHNLSRIKF